MAADSLDLTGDLTALAAVAQATAELGRPQEARDVLNQAFLMSFDDVATSDDLSFLMCVV